MASEEEVKITILTISDLTGTQALAESFRQAQQAGQQAQSNAQQSVQQLQAATQQVGQAVRQAQTGTTSVADQMMRSLMATGPQTLQEFQSNVERLKRTMRLRPGELTLVPADFGIQEANKVAKAAADVAAQAPTVSRQFALAVSRSHDEATRQLTGGIAGNPPPRPPQTPQPSGPSLPPVVELARFAGAAVGVGFGLSAYAAAGRLVQVVISQVIDRTVALNRAFIDNTLTMGQSAAAFQDWARTVSQDSGIAESSLLQVGTAAQVLSRQVVVGPDTVQNLTNMAIALHNIQGIDVTQAMNLLSAAIGGSQQAQAALNLELDDGYVAFTQLDGASQAVFSNLDAGTQKALRYASAQEQINRNIREAPTGPVQDLQRAQTELNAEWERAATTAGPGFIEALAQVVSAYNALVRTGREDQAQARAAGNTNGLLDRLRELSQSFHPERTATGAGGIFSELGKEARDFADSLPGILEGLPGQIGAIFEQIRTSSRSFLSQRIEIDVSPLQAAATQAGTLLSQIGQQVSQLSQQIASSGLGQALLGIFGQVGGAARSLTEQLGRSGLGQAIQNLVGPAMEQANEQFAKYTDQLIATAGRLQEQLLATLEKTRAQIDAVFSDITNKARDYADQLSKTGLGQAIGAGVENTQANLRAAQQEAQNFITAVSNDAQDFKNQMGGALGAVPGLAEQAKESVVQVGGSLVQAGRDAIAFGQATAASLQAQTTANGELIAKLQDVREARGARGTAIGQLADMGAFNALNAARQNEIIAARELDNLQQSSLDLTAQEAQIRLSMLPTQQRLVELQNQANLAQIEATQRTLPATRALEDLQNQVQLQRIRAGNPNLSIAERTEAARTGALLFQQTPAAEEAALRARIAATPAQRAAEDIGREAQHFEIQQKQAIDGLEYSRQQVGFLQQIAEAVSGQATRAVLQLSTYINVYLQNAGAGPLSDDQLNAIATASMNGTVSAFHSAVQQVNQRAPTQLLGALTP